MTTRRKRPGRRPSSLAGTHLYLDPSGIYQWRRVDPVTGRRLKRSTGTGLLELALKKAAVFEERWERRRVGLKDLDCWKLDLAPLIRPFVRSLGNVLPRTRKQLRRSLVRAMRALKVRRASDLDDVGGLQVRLEALAEREALTPSTARRCYQEPLRRFSAWLAGNKRHLDRDPLLSWEPVAAPRGKSARRAFLPEEVARALLAADALDVIHRRQHPTRVPFTVLLVTAPRIGALLAADVEALDEARARIDLGEDVKTKRKGAAALDEATLDELRRYVAGRREGPLLLSPRSGRRWPPLRFLDLWREAFSLGVLDGLWPAEAPRDLELLHLVNQAVLTGSVKVSRGGNPKLVKASTVAARDQRAREVHRLARELRPGWEAAMRGVDSHAARKTHRTWALAAGVLPPAVDKQLGHASQDPAESFEILRVAAGSRTGRAHYLDVGSALFDPRTSAEAVRRLLDEAVAGLRARGDSVLVAPEMAPVAREATA